MSGGDSTRPNDSSSGTASDTNAPPRGLRGSKRPNSGLRWLVLGITVVGLAFGGLMYYRYSADAGPCSTSML